MASIIIISSMEGYVQIKKTTFYNLTSIFINLNNSWRKII